MKKFTVLGIAALSIGVLYAADSQPASTPQAPTADQAPKPLPPLEQAGKPGAGGGPDHRKWMMRHGGQGAARPDKGGPNQGFRPHGPDSGKFGSCPPGEGKFGFHGRGDQKLAGKPGRDRGEMLADALQLTPDQKTKAKAIMMATRPKLQAIQQEARDKARGVMEESMKELRPILTPEQQSVFDDLQKLRADKVALDAAKKVASAIPVATPAPGDTKSE